MKKNSSLKKLKPLDYVLIFVFVCIAVISLFFARQNQGGGPKLIVSSPQDEWIYSLDDDQNLEFEGAIGVTHITIDEGQVSFVQSPCDNQTCILSPPLQKNGNWAACLPNRIVARIEGEKDENSKSMQNTDESLDTIGF